MRLVTWNCCSGSVDGRLKQLARLTPDVVVLQEVAQITTPPDGPFVHWRGTSPRKGVAIVSRTPGYALTPVDAPPDVAPRTAAAVVHTREPFLLVAMWAHPRPSYAYDAVATIRAWRALVSGLPLVVAGDFNVELKAPFATAPHRRLGQCLHDECGLVSGYHVHHAVPLGCDDEPPTYRHLRKARRTWHIDYCFVPAAWAPRLRSVDVIDGRTWRKRSDHSPVVVEWEE